MLKMFNHAERSMVTSSSSLDLSGSMRPPEDSTDEEEDLEPDTVLNHEPEQVAAADEQDARESKHRTVDVDAGPRTDAVHSMVPRPPPVHFPGASYQARLTRARSAKRSPSCSSPRSAASACLDDIRYFGLQMFHLRKKRRLLTTLHIDCSQNMRNLLQPCVQRLRRFLASSILRCIIILDLSCIVLRCRT